MPLLRFEEGWSHLHDMWVGPCFNLFSGPIPMEHRFTSAEMVSAYTICYRMCTQRNPNNFSPRLYRRYQLALEEFVHAHVVPGFAMSVSDDRALLRELAARWTQHQALLREFPRPFHYLERYYIPASRMPSLEKAGEAVFRDLACRPNKARILEAFLSLGALALNGDEGSAAVVGLAFRALEAADQDMAMEVVDAWVEVGLGVDAERARQWGRCSGEAEAQDRLLRDICRLPMAPSQGALSLRFTLQKLRLLLSPNSPTVSPSVTPRSTTVSPTAITREDGPPAKLSRTAATGNFSSFPASSGPSASASAFVGAGVKSASPQRAVLCCESDGREGGVKDVLREVVFTLKDDLFRELIDSLFLAS